MKILIVEDEPEMRNNLVSSLEKEHYVVECAPNYLMAIDKVIGHEYDCILLDITLPDGNGLHLLKELKDLGKMDSVIIISAKNSVDDKLKGFELGADDYLTKPFHIAELNARIKSVLRRKSFGGKKSIELKNVNIDTEDRQVSIDNEIIPLNRKEFDVLLYLVSNKDRLVTRTALAEHVWGDHVDEADDFEFIYSQIKNLRKKLKDHQAGIEIQAVYGIGYKLVTV